MNKTVCRKVKLDTSSLNEGDIFILDLGKKVYQFNGKNAGVGERHEAAKVTRSIDDQRGSVDIVVCTSADADDGFWGPLGGKKHIKSAKEGGDDSDVADKKKLFKLSDESGKMEFTNVPAKKSSLENDEVFIYDCINVIFIWVGKAASTEERKLGLHYATKYLSSLPDRPPSTSIVRVIQGGENEEFEASF